MHCTNCGAELNAEDKLCPACGVAVTEGSTPVPAETPVAPVETAQSETAHAVPGIGWSDKLDDPLIQKMANRQRKSAKVFGYIFGLIFPIGFAVAGLLIKSIPFWQALVVGVVLGLIMAAVAFFRLLSLNKPVWEGTVADKTAVEHTDKKSKTHTLYTIIVKGVGSGKRQYKFKDDPDLYEYFDVGDKVRYYPVFGTYEKRDKTHDTVIFCNVCSAKNDIANANCTRCKSPLFK